MTKARNAKRDCSRATEAMREHAGEAAQLLKALANESRLMVLCTLSEGELSVGQLNELVDLSQSALSQHLSVLHCPKALPASLSNNCTISIAVTHRHVRAIRISGIVACRVQTWPAPDRYPVTTPVFSGRIGLSSRPLAE